jgi:hypothetical protein
MQVVQHTDTIWTIENFLSGAECAEMIGLSEALGYEEAEVSLPGGARMMKGLRNNYRLLHQDVALADRYWQQLRQEMPCVSFTNRNTKAAR